MEHDWTPEEIAEAEAMLEAQHREEEEYVPWAEEQRRLDAKLAAPEPPDYEDEDLTELPPDVADERPPEPEIDDWQPDDDLPF